MSTVRWKDIFPWIDDSDLAGAVSVLAEKEVPAELSDSPEAQRVLSHIDTRLVHQALGTVFPRVDQELSLDALTLRPASANVLRQRRIWNVADLLACDIRSMAPTQGAGAGFRRDLLAALLLASILTVMFQGSDAPDSQNHSLSAGEEDSGDPTSGAVKQALREHLPEPQDVRGFDILLFRVFSDAPETLEELGKRHGVTRERIRQLETVLSAKLKEAAGAQPLADVLEALRQRIGTLSPLEEVAADFPVLNEELADWGIPIWRILSKISEDIEIDGTWCAVPSLQTVREETQAELEEKADRYGVVPLKELNLDVGGSEEDRIEAAHNWIAGLGYRTFGEHALLRTSSMHDYAAAILAVMQTPLTSTQILERFEHKRSARSLRNQLAADDRFVRADRDTWALAEWGVAEYQSIKKLILEEVEKAGGEVRLSEVTERLSSQFSISPTSVAAYAVVPPLTVIDGMVTTSHESPRVTATVNDSARFYRRGRAWLYRVAVNNEHVRGSGTPAPVALIPLLDLEHGGRKLLPSELGDQSVYWTGVQPTFGTLRRFIEHLDVHEGDEVFLVFRDDGTFTVEKVAKLTGDPLADALALVGAPNALPREVAQRALGMSIDASYMADLDELAQKYADRGDQDVADLLLKGD